MSNFDEAVETLVAEITEFNKQMTDRAQALFADLAKEFFKVPGLESFSWSQYTPYFNDGDVCYFRVNSDCYVNEMDSYELRDLAKNAESLDVLEDRLKKLLKEQEAAAAAKDYVKAASFIRPIESLQDDIKLAEKGSDYKALHEVCEKIGNTLDKFPQHLMKTMFGDHCKITVTPDKIKVTSYDHD